MCVCVGMHYVDRMSMFRKVLWILRWKVNGGKGV